MKPSSAPQTWRSRITDFLIGCVIFFFIMLFCSLIGTPLFMAIDCGSQHLPTLQVESATLTSLQVNKTKLTGDFNISLSVQNPTDTARVYFSQLSVELFHKDEDFSIVLNKSSFPSFYILPPFFTDRLGGFILTPSVNGSVVPGVANGINHSRSEFDRVQFGLNVNASVKYKNKIFHFHSSSKTLKVVCFPLVFQVSPNSNNTEAPGTLLNAVTCSQTDSD